jgi:hypothetical protein
MPVLNFFATCKAADDKGTSESGFSVKGRLWDGFCFGFTSALTCGLLTYLGLELKSQGEGGGKEMFVDLTGRLQVSLTSFKENN